MVRVGFTDDGQSNTAVGAFALDELVTVEMIMLRLVQVR